MKHSRGREKALLPTAGADLLPARVVNPPKSTSPGAADATYAEAVTTAPADVLRTPEAPLFELVDHAALETAFCTGPASAGRVDERPRRDVVGSRARRGAAGRGRTWSARAGRRELGGLP